MGNDQTWISAFLTFMGAVIVLIILGVLLGLAGLPLWPFVMLLLVYATIDGFDNEKFKWEWISGFIGILAGMSQHLVTELTGSAIAATAVFFVLAMALGTGFVKGKVKWASLFGILMLSILTLYSFNVGQLSGVAGVSAVEDFARVIVAYVIGIGLNYALGAAVHKVMGGKAKTADENKVEAGPSQA